MTPARKLIHSLIACFSEFQACIDEFNGLFVIADGHNDQIFDIGFAVLNIFSDVEFATGGVQ